MSQSLSDAQNLLVTARNVHKSYGDNEVLKGIDLDVKQSEVVVILGPSGSGKSTFLRCINHLEDIDRGTIMVGGEQIGYELHGDRLRKLSERGIARQRRDIGMVFQQFNLYPHMTVLQNIVEAPIGVHKQSRHEAEAYARALLEKVGLSDKAHAYPRHLSGGQQQRVAIARALAIKPKLMLFDEPTSALDPEMIREVIDVMADLSAEGMTSIVVTHEMGFARRAANHIVFMENGEIIEHATGEKFFGGDVSQRAQRFLDQILH